MNKEEIKTKFHSMLKAGLYLQHVREEVPYAMETTFDELGLDSLDKIEIKLSIEDDFEIELPEDSFAVDVQTVEDAIDLIMKHA